MPVCWEIIKGNAGKALRFILIARALQTPHFEGLIVIISRGRFLAINQVERASRAWPILISRARNRTTISYGELGAALGVHHRAIRFVLGVLQDYCLEEGIPPITILIVNASGKPGTGFIAYDLNHFDEGLQGVYSFDWTSIENPFIFAETGESYESLVNTLSESPEDSEDIYTLVKSRGIKQILFRDALLKVYANKCAFTEISFMASLEACHIVPWSQALPSERLDVRNGLLLNSFHHKLFDNGFVTLSPTYRIVYCDSQASDGSYSEFDRLLTVGLHGKKMHLPRLVKHQPGLEFIKRHHRITEWEDGEVEI